jgi:hypothetical protein
MNPGGRKPLGTFWPKPMKTGSCAKRSPTNPPESQSNHTVKSTKQKKPIGDVTRTARAVAHLERLGANNGKRLVVDLDASGTMALEELLSAGYGETQKAVVVKALLAASAGLKTRA